MKNRRVQNQQNNPEKESPPKNMTMRPFGPRLRGCPKGYEFPEEAIPTKGKPKRDWWEHADRKTKGLAHFCLPLMTANGAGYYLRSPVHFKCSWNGDVNADAKLQIIDRLPHGVVDTHSTHGGFTVQSGITFETENPGDFLWVKQLPNLYRPWFYPMEGLLEGWWRLGGATIGLVCLLNRPGTYEMKIGDPIAQVVMISKKDLDANLVFDNNPDPESYNWQAKRTRPEYGKGGPDLDYLRGLWSNGMKEPVHYSNMKKNKVIRNDRK